MSSEWLFLLNSEWLILSGSNNNTSLKDKLEILSTCDWGFNTDIEAVFDLILDMAKCNKVPREELPKQVLVISDMEFDMARGNYSSWYDDEYADEEDDEEEYAGNEEDDEEYAGDEEEYAGDEEDDELDEALFEEISKKFEAAGYKMPRLIFWNVCSRSDTVPMVDNEEGLCLLSGFSQNAMKVAANREIKDPYEALIAVLDSPRYEKIEEAIKNVVA